MPQDNNSKMIQVTGLWLNDSKTGQKFMKGYMGNMTVLIFANKFKENDSHPDFIMYFSEKQKREESTKDENPFEGLDG